MRARSREPALVDDEILVADWPALEIAFEDFACARRVACLGRERCARDMRRHPVMWHSAPRMIFWGWLREPDVSRIACELTALERTHNRIAVADFCARGVHDIGAALHLRNHRVVKE